MLRYIVMLKIIRKYMKVNGILNTIGIRCCVGLKNKTKTPSVIHQSTAASAPARSVCSRSNTALDIPFCAGKLLLTGAWCTDSSMMTPQPVGNTDSSLVSESSHWMFNYLLSWICILCLPVFLFFIMNINVVMCWKKFK